MSDTEGQTAYRVLARKYRPQNFADLIGQDAMVRTLRNAISSGRLAHAFILTGVRGIGKTTTARLIARALNCVGPDGTGGPTIDPCGVCDSCTAIAEDRHVDVMEMDAASRTGVDNMRELIEGVRYRPVSARYKIYIIDEVHMLSTAAFNALLKTLEEPPEHVKFIFATTETRKVPVTVLSRCQRFDLRRVDAATLSGHFKTISEKEEVAISDSAIRLIARAADGSVRDGLSLLDQAIAHAGGSEAEGEIDDLQIRDMLGLADGVAIFDLYDELMGGNIGEALERCRGLYDAGADPITIVQDILELTYLLTRLKLAPNDPSADALSDVERDRAKDMAERLSMPVLTRAWQMLLKGLGEVQYAPSTIQALEMLLVRLAHASSLPAPGDILAKLQGEDGAVAGGGAPAPSGNGAGSTASGSSGSAALAVAASTPEPVQAPPAPQPSPDGQPGTVLQTFEDVIALFSEHREILLVSQLKSTVRLVSFQPGMIEFQPTADAAPDLANQVMRLLREWTGQPWMVTVSTAGQAMPTISEQEAAAKQAVRDEVMAHPLIKSTLEEFPGAEITGVEEIAPDENDLAAEGIIEPLPGDDGEDDDEEDPLL